MFPSRLFIKERFVIACAFVLLLGLSDCVPVNEHSEVNFGFPTEVQTSEQHPSSNNGSCFEYVKETFNEEVTSRNGGVESTTVVPRKRTVKRCCAGYAGTNCNETINTTISLEDTNPCSQLNCTNHPDAMCAIVTRCGVEIPVFLNDRGEVVDCGNHRPLEELKTGSCRNFCPFNPCVGQTCEEFPSAVCLTSACDCKPLWLLETGVKVNCTSGEQLLPERTLRAKRQAVPSSSCTR